MKADQNDRQVPQGDSAMFDKICKVIALIIFAFIAYSLYLHALNSRYDSLGNRGAVIDQQTGKIYIPEPVKSNP